MMSDEGDSVMTSYKSPTDTTPAPDDVNPSGAYRCPSPHLTTRDPIDPRPVGCVRISRSEIAVYPEKDSSVGLDIPEHVEVLDCHTMTRMSVGRVASRYEFGANLSVQYNGQTWRVETWRERAMRYEEKYKDAIYPESE